MLDYLTFGGNREMDTVVRSEPPGMAFDRKPEERSGVSWGAVFAGSFVGTAFYLILLALGAGFGLSTAPAWSANVSHTKLGAGLIVWLVFSEVMAAALGGYLTGRLRVRWVLTHSDEVHFRDTA